MGPPEKERPGAPSSDRVNPEVRKPPQPPHSASKRNAAVRQCAGLAVFDWRAAARLTETSLKPIDHALTATGLAAEIRECVGRML